MKIKPKINKWDLIKQKLWHSKGNYKQNQKTEWEKVFANEATDKGLISKIYKQLMQLNILKKKKPHKKLWGGELNRHFSEEDIQVTMKHMKRCSTLLIIRKIKLKNYNEVSLHTSWNGHYQKIYNVGEGVEKREPSDTVGGNVNWCSYYGEQYGGFLKN